MEERGDHEQLRHGRRRSLIRVPKWRTLIVIHANHANEIDGAVKDALSELAGCGATLLNQSVLLKGINDDVEALADLSEALFAAGVMP